MGFYGSTHGGDGGRVDPPFRRFVCLLVGWFQFVVRLLFTRMAVWIALRSIASGDVVVLRGEEGFGFVSKRVSERRRPFFPPLIRHGMAWHDIDKMDG